MNRTITSNTPASFIRVKNMALKATSVAVPTTDFSPLATYSLNALKPNPHTTAARVGRRIKGRPEEMCSLINTSQNAEHHNADDKHKRHIIVLSVLEFRVRVCAASTQTFWFIFLKVGDYFIANVALSSATLSSLSVRMPWFQHKIEFRCFLQFLSIKTGFTNIFPGNNRPVIRQ